MAQSIEDGSADEVELQYFCHLCDDIVEDIQYEDDGTIKCNICNGTYVEILDPDDEDHAPQNTSSAQSQSNNGNPNNNNNNNNTNQNQNQNRQINWNNGNRQVFYFQSSNLNNGQPIQINNGQPMRMNMPNIGQIIHQSIQQIGSQPMNNLFNFGGQFNNMMQQMVDNDQGPPPTSNNTINDLPEYAYDGPTPVDEDDTDEDTDHDTSLKVTDEGNTEDITHESDQKQNTKEDVMDDKNRECAICKDKFHKGEMLKELPCTHRFHKDCIMPWLTRRNTCPTCRHRLPTDNAFYEQMENARERQQNNPNNNGAPGFNAFLNQMFANNNNNNQ
eukprot:104081_1